MILLIHFHDFACKSNHHSYLSFLKILDYMMSYIN